MVHIIKKSKHLSIKLLYSLFILSSIRGINYGENLSGKDSSGINNIINTQYRNITEIKGSMW